MSVQTVMSVEDVIDRARQATGYQTALDAGLIEGIEMNLKGFADAPLTQQARDQAIQGVVNNLTMRMRIESYLAEHPEIEDQEIEGPLIVTSMPRTGTTASVAMLALDPRFRFTRAWELQSPLPPPVLEEEENDPRVLAARAAAGAVSSSIHLFEPDGPEEDLVSMAGYDMRHYYGRYPMPEEYLEWYFADDFSSVYRFHARLLKLLQWRHGPNRWLLKAPPHLRRFKAIVKQYPKARIVMTHRDPVTAVCSNASLSAMLYESICPPGAVSKEWTGKRALDFWSKTMEAALQQREELGEEYFVDLYNSDLVADPIGTFEKLYEQLGYTIDADLRAKLEDYHARNAKGAHGEHTYSAEEYGLDPAEIRAAFKGYIDRFGL